SRHVHGAVATPRRGDDDAVEVVRHPQLLARLLPLAGAMTTWTLWSAVRAKDVATPRRGDDDQWIPISGSPGDVALRRLAGAMTPAPVSRGAAGRPVGLLPLAGAMTTPGAATRRRGAPPRCYPSQGR